MGSPADGSGHVVLLLAQPPGGAALGVALDVLLLLARDAERPRRHVARDDRAGRRERVVADGDRGDDGRVAAGAHAVADAGRVLVVAVVVGGDVAGGDVAVPADDRVADVAEVRHLAALADAAVLDLDEGAGLGALGQHRVGTDVGEGADVAAGADDALVEVRADHPGAVADERVLEEAAGTHLAGRTDGGAPEQVRVGADERVAAHLDAVVHEGRAGSSTVTPASMRRSTRRRRMIALTTASSTSRCIERPSC